MSTSKLHHASTLPVNMNKYLKRQQKKEKFEKGERILTKLAQMIDKPFRSQMDHVLERQERGN